MKRIITIAIMCIFIYSLSSCTKYENITFIENISEHRLLYQGNEYYEAAIFDVSEYDGIKKDENDVELGWYYSFPFGTQFYSESAENPIFIYTLGSYKSMFFRQDYDYSNDVFVIEDTDKEIVWNDIFVSEENNLPYARSIRVYLQSKQYPRIRTYLDLVYIENRWYIILPKYSPTSQIGWIPSDEFINVLLENGII